MGGVRNAWSAAIHWGDVRCVSARPLAPARLNRTVLAAAVLLAALAPSPSLGGIGLPPAGLHSTSDPGVWAVSFLYDPPMIPHVIVRASIDGHGPLPLVLDTGCTWPMVLDSGVARELGLAPGKDPNTASIHSLLLPDRLSGGLALTGEVGVHLEDLGAIRYWAGGERVAGLLGLPVLRHFVLRLDFCRRMMTGWISGSVPPPSGDLETVKLQDAVFPEGALLVQVNLDDGKRADLVLDTGTDHTSLPAGLLATVRPVGATKRVSGTLRSILLCDQAILPGLSIGRVKERSVAVDGQPPGEPAALGLDLLSRFRVTFDFGRHLMALDASPDHDVRSRLEGFSGLMLQEEAGKLQVGYVVPGSPAAGAGVCKGDRICEIDGYAAAVLPLALAERLADGFEGTTLRLVVERSDHGRLSFSFRRERLLMDRPGPLFGVILQKGLSPTSPVLVAFAAADPGVGYPGVRSGDELVTINGHTAKELNLPALRDECCRPRCHLSLKRKGERSLLEVWLPRDGRR